MRLLLITDAWFPQVNGVVRALSTVSEHLQARGHEVIVLGPDRFRSVPAPTYPEIRLALATPRSVGRIIDEVDPDAAHIATDPSGTIPTVGASGAISGIMGAYMVLYPRVRVQTLIFLIIYIRVIPLPAWALLAYWFFLQVLEGSVALGQEGGGVAFWAHVGGFAAGVVLVKLFEKRKLVTAKRAGHRLTREEMGRWDPW